MSVKQKPFNEAHDGTIIPYPARISYISNGLKFVLVTRDFAGHKSYWVEGSQGKRLTPHYFFSPDCCAEIVKSVNAKLQCGKLVDNV